MDIMELINKVLRRQKEEANEDLKAIADQQEAANAAKQEVAATEAAAEGLTTPPTPTGVGHDLGSTLDQVPTHVESPDDDPD